MFFGRVVINFVKMRHTLICGVGTQSRVLEKTFPPITPTLFLSQKFPTALCHVYVDLWAILTGYGYQMISEDQKEAEVVKDSHVVTLVVSNNLYLPIHTLCWHTIIIIQKTSVYFI